MNTGIPLYEGDGHLHPRPAPSLLAAGAAARVAKKYTLPTPEQVLSIEQEARRMRAATLAAMLRSLFDRIERSSRDAWRKQAERYLARSTDAGDLERRMRGLDRNGRIYG